jgi:hypothetical protein
VFDGGANKDSDDSGTVVLTSEGTAPYVAEDQDTAFAQSRRAVRVLEAEVALSPGCVPGKAQARQSGFADCTPLPPPAGP